MEGSTQTAERNRQGLSILVKDGSYRYPRLILLHITVPDSSLSDSVLALHLFCNTPNHAWLKWSSQKTGLKHRFWVTRKATEWHSSSYQQEDFQWERKDQVKKFFQQVSDTSLVQSIKLLQGGTPKMKDANTNSSTIIVNCPLFCWIQTDPELRFKRRMQAATGLEFLTVCWGVTRKEKHLFLYNSLCSPWS